MKSNPLGKGIALRNKYLSAFIAFSLFFVSASAQPFIIKVKDYKNGIPGVEKEIDVTVLMPATSGTPKSYVDSTSNAVTKNLQNYINTSFNNLQTWTTNQLALKADKGTIGGTTEGQVVTLTPQVWNKIYQPPYYGKTYDNGTTQGRYFAGGLSTNEGVNFSTNRPDPVYTIAAYNIATPNGSRELTNEAAWDMSIETHYDAPGAGTVPGDFEAHLFREYDSKGREHRHLSGYFNKTTGVGRWDMVADALNLMHPNTHGEQPFVWATLSQSQLTLQPIAGGGAALFMYAPDGQSRVTFSYIGGNPILDMPGAFYTDAFGNTKIKVGTYADDTEAASNGVKVGYNYYTRINGRLVLTVREK